MSYKLGDQFIATISEVNDTGMGVTYTLNDAILVNANQLVNLKPCVDRPNKPVDELKDEKPKEYTPEELLERIFVIMKLLNKTTEAYLSARSKLKTGIDEADSEVGRLNG